MPNTCPELSATVYGDRNPVRVACAWLSWRVPADMIDFESFEKTATAVGEVDDFGRGLVVIGADDLARLCGIGRFQIVIEETGTFHARKP